MSNKLLIEELKAWCEMCAKHPWPKVQDCGIEIEEILAKHSASSEAGEATETKAEPGATIADCERRLDELVEEYEWDDGESHHLPTENESCLLTDFAHGLFSDEKFVALVRGAFTHPAPLPDGALWSAIESLEGKLERANESARRAASERAEQLLARADAAEKELAQWRERWEKATGGVVREWGNEYHVPTLGQYEGKRVRILVSDE
jgi:hypothetical protein